MSARRLSTGLLIACLAGLAIEGGAPPRPTAAQIRPVGAFDEALAARVSGDWQLAITSGSALALVNRGIAQAVSGLPPMVDALAARELRARTPVSPDLSLEVTQDRIRSRFVDRTYATAPGQPASFPIPGEAGATMEVVQLLRDGHLEQIFTTARGRRWSTLTPSTDGQSLTLDAVIHSERLPADVRFRLPYRRVR